MIKMNTKAAGILILIAIGLVLFGAGCTGKDETATPQYTDPSAALGEEIAEFERINSSVNLSLGEMLTATGRVWRHSITTIVEVGVTNTGEEDISIAYAVALFNNGKDPIARSWDDEDRIIEPRETESFYFRVDPVYEDLFEANNSVNFEFALTSAVGNNQTMIYKGESLIPWTDKSESSDLNITRMTE